MIHDGVDTELIAPKPGTRITVDGLDSGSLTLSKDDEVITYSVRNLEPSRGFHVFMRALSQLQKRRPRAITVIVGGDEVSYGKPHPSGKCWREVLLEEVKGELDMSRVMFVGKLPYPTLLNLFRISSLHIYLTTPFVLSWSMLEAMACGTPVLASATAPVMEVIEDGVNGVLFDYHRGQELVEKVDTLLSQPALLRQLGARGRESIVDRYDLKTRCLPEHIRFIESLLAS
ncbi:MAG: glycosyltransferase [Porticoccaceae bacterium]